jgi:hypothetical protein
MSEIPTGASAEPGANPKRGKTPNIDISLPVDNYPMSEFESGAPNMNDNLRKGATGEPVNTNPDISAGEQSAEKYGLGKGKDGAI